MTNPYQSTIDAIALDSMLNNQLCIKPATTLAEFRSSYPEVTVSDQFGNIFYNEIVPEYLVDTDVSTIESVIKVYQQIENLFADNPMLKKMFAYAYSIEDGGVYAFMYIFIETNEENAEFVYSIGYDEWVTYAIKVAGA